MKALLDGVNSVQFHHSDGSTYNGIYFYIPESQADKFRGFSLYAPFEIFDSRDTLVKSLYEKDEEIARLRSILYD